MRKRMQNKHMTPTLAAIGIVAEDLAASLAFYQELGVAVPEVRPEDHHVEATLESGLRLMWDSHVMMQRMDPDWRASQGQGLTLAFSCGDAEGVDSVYSHLVALGYNAKTAPFDAPWGQRYCVVIDPDGYSVDLFAPLS